MLQRTRIQGAVLGGAIILLGGLTTSAQAASPSQSVPAATKSVANWNQIYSSGSYEALPANAVSHSHKSWKKGRHYRRGHWRHHWRHHRIWHHHSWHRVPVRSWYPYLYPTYYPIYPTYSPGYVTYPD
jgi:hypothetical protein